MCERKGFSDEAVFKVEKGVINMTGRNLPVSFVI
jgi:hypothetical protein